MTKKLTFLLLLLWVAQLTYGQCINSFPVFTTDPAVSNQQRNVQGKLNSWDWTRDIFVDVYVTQQPNGTNPICTEIYAPWHNTQINNPNVTSLVMQRGSNPNILDIYPVDGWELLTKNMGRRIIDSSDGSERMESVQNPSFSIYNRRTGSIKFFLYITNTTYTSPTRLNITLQYTENRIGRPITGAMLNHRDSVLFILPEFNHLVKQSGQSSYDGVPRVNEACNGTGYWITAEFLAQFDPCSCYPDYESIVEFFIEFIADKTISMSIDGDITGTVVRSLYNNSVYLNNSSLQKSKFEGILGNVSAPIDGILKGYKNAKEFNEFALKLVNPKTDNLGNIIKPALFKGATAKKIAAKGAVFGPKGLLIAAGVGLVYSYVKANKSNKSRVETPKPITYEKNFKLNLRANGTILSMPQVFPTKFFVPGSPNQLQGFSSAKPIYNNTLGILSFTQLPKLQFVQWTLPIDNMLGSQFKLNQYRLTDEPIKYILNPASGLTIDKIEAQIVLELDERSRLSSLITNYDMNYRPPYSGVFQFGKANNGLSFCEGVDEFEKQHTASGLQITNWLADATSYDQITVATPFLNLPCIHEQTFVMNNNEKFKAFIKLHVIFRVVNKFGAITQPEGYQDEEELIEYVVTYPIQLESQPINGYNNGPFVHLVYRVNGVEYPVYNNMDEASFWLTHPNLQEKYRDNLFVVPNSPGPWGNVDMKEVLPVSLVVDNITLSGNQEFKALETIEIGENVVIQSGSDIKFLAGKEILFSPIFEGETIAQFEIGLDPSMYLGICEQIEYNSTPNLDHICASDSPYYDRTRILTKTNQKTVLKSMNEVEIVKNVSLFPNPADDFTTVRFDIMKESKITAELLDIKGQVLKTLALNKYYPIGDFELTINIQDITQGIYLIRLIDENGFKQVYKLVKQ